MTQPNKPRMPKDSWRLFDIFYRLTEGDDEWAERRFMILLLMILVFTLMGRATEQIEPFEFLQPFFAGMPPLLRSVFNFGASLLHPQTLRHLMPPVVGAVLAILLSANYVRDLFELPNFNTGLTYLQASLFGWDYPRIKITHAGYDKHEETNPIPKIGGPGFVTIDSGVAAIFERVGGPSKVAGEGKHFLRRFESLREVIDLRDQLRSFESTKVFTKDGIPVTVRDIKVSFRVHRSHRTPRTAKELYPFAVGAVRRIAYTKTVSPAGPSSWVNGVPGAVIGDIKGFISRNMFDDVVARPDTDNKEPRDKIKEALASKDSRKKYLGMGVDLLWVSLGHIEPAKEAQDAHVSTWRSVWERHKLVKLTKGDATKMRLTQYAQIIARLEMLERFAERIIQTNENIPPEVLVAQIAEALKYASTSTSFSMKDEAKMEDRIFKRVMAEFESSSFEPPLLPPPPTTK